MAAPPPAPAATDIDVAAPPYEAFPAGRAPGAPLPTDKTHNVTARPADVDARAANAFSLDDLEVAKALTGLRSASPAQSTSSHTAMSMTSPRPTPQSPLQPASAQQEPLFSLLTSQHPLIASTINNSLSAYSSSKTYSARFRQGAEFVERNLASPVASTVSTATRISGVENGVRWMLRRRESSSGDDAARANGADPAGPEDATALPTPAAAGTPRAEEAKRGAGADGHKRRRLDPDAMEIEADAAAPGGQRSREPSVASAGEFLPAYDDNRSPVYTEYAVVPTTSAPGGSTAGMPQNWQTRLMISTSGLGVAMSDESLRSLRYCLSWLKWANGHLSRVLDSLHSVLQEWDRSQDADRAPDPPLSPSAPPPRDADTIAKHLAALRAECVRTLKSALDVVSTYAGGALPENARHLVRRHLTSLPMRFQMANGAGASGSQAASAAASRRGSAMQVDSEAQASTTPEAVTAAQRVVVLAREGLDMMAQVSAVVDGTIVSAESWCQRLGRRPASTTPGAGGEMGAEKKEDPLVKDARGEKRGLGGEQDVDMA